MGRQAELLSQMGYLVDELDAQLSVIDLIPTVLWDARPPGAGTLREMYQAMLSREARAHRESLGLAPLEPALPDSPVALLREIAAMRTRTLNEISALDPDESRLDACFAITQADADALREVGLRLNEASMGAPRVARM